MKNPLVTTILLSSMFSAASQAQLPPYHIKVVHPQSSTILGGQLERVVDCQSAMVIDGKIYATPEFIQQIDSNNQDVTLDGAGKRVVPDPRTITTLEDARRAAAQFGLLRDYQDVEEARIHVASIILRLAFNHMRQVHGTCLSADECPLLDANEGCKRVLGVGVDR